MGSLRLKQESQHNCLILEALCYYPLLPESALGKSSRGLFIPRMMLLGPPQQWGKMRLSQCFLSFSCLTSWSVVVFVGFAVYGMRPLTLLPQVLTNLWSHRDQDLSPWHPFEYPVWEALLLSPAVYRVGIHTWVTWIPPAPIHPFFPPFSGRVIGFEMPGKVPWRKTSGNSVFLALSPDLL